MSLDIKHDVHYDLVLFCLHHPVAPTSPTCNVTGSILPVITYQAPVEITAQNISTSSFSALVTVCENGQYGAICSNGFDNTAAALVCQDIVDQSYPGATVTCKYFITGK